MKNAFRKTTTAVAAVATAGVSSLFMGVAPASAATETCGDVGTLVAPGICELVFTGDGVFTRTAQMTKLEALLVGAGGNSVGSPYIAPSEGNPAGSNGYAAAGGGGEVRVVDLTSTTGPVTVSVATHAVGGSESSAAAGALDEAAANGANGIGPTSGPDGATGGDSGNGNQGVEFDVPSSAPYGGGGGATSAAGGANGGAGVVVSDLMIPATSLFATDDRCFGGGGGAGAFNVPEVTNVVGSSGCGAGYAVADGSVAAPVANSGGGAGATSLQLSADVTTGADGIVILRWNSYQALAATGSGLNTTTMSIGISVLVAGIALAMAAAYTRKRRSAE